MEKYNITIINTIFTHNANSNKPHFPNLYQLNIKHKKINSIPYRYIPVKKITKEQLNIELFLINTGGNHIPTGNIKLKKLMENSFPEQTKYEIVKDKQRYIFLTFIFYNYFPYKFIYSFKYKYILIL